MYDRYGAYAFGLAFNISGSRVLAEEAVQDAFMALWRDAAASGAGDQCLHGHLLSIVHQRAVSAVRGKKGARGQGRSAACSSVLPASGAEEAIPLLRRRNVVDALSELPTSQREAIRLVYLDGLTCRDAAEMLGIPVEAARARLREGLKNFQSASRAGSQPFIAAGGPRSAAT